MSKSDPFAPKSRRERPATPRRLAVPDTTAVEVLAWVQKDPERAAAALAFEERREKPRRVLMRDLSRLLERPE